MENSELIIQESSLMTKMGTIQITERGMELRTIDDVYRIAKAVSKSQLNPNGWNDADILLVLLNAAEIGLRPLQALASSYIVNNRVCLFGDAPRALIEASGLLEDYEEKFTGKPFDDDFTAVVTTKRKGRKPLTTEFSVLDAKTAGLWDKSIFRNGKETSPWRLYPKRMLGWRARGYNFKDNFADVFRGTTILEIEDDHPSGFENAKPAKMVEPNFGPDFAKVKEAVKNAAPPTEPPKPVEPRTPEPNIGRLSRSEQGPARGTKPEPTASKAPPAPTKTDSPEAPPPVAPKEAPPAPAEVTPYAELTKRLAAEGISDTRFLLVMSDFGFLPGVDKEDVSAGNITIGKLTAKAITTALKDWQTVVNNLPPL